MEDNIQEEILAVDNNEVVVSDSNETTTEEYNYEALDKEGLLEEVKRVKLESALSVSKTQLSDLKSAFDSLFRSEREEAYNKFIEEGGEKDGFEYNDRTVQDFFDTYKSIGELKRKHRVEQEEQRVLNTKKKKQLLEDLRELVDGEESKDTFDKVKEIQKTWKETGHVSQADFYEMSANYHALLDRYYSFRSVYFDLKSLDRNKNLQVKQAIVEEAEKLLGAENSLNAIKELNDLHAQYKNIGPVPEVDSEPLWLKFKEVSDKIHEQRAAQIELFKVQLSKNLELKRGILQLLTPFETLQLESPKEWGKQTDNIQLLQEGWKQAGPIPNEDKKAINDEFWRICRAFYANKSAYFGQLDNVREQNLEKKKALISKVEALKDDEDFKETAEKIKRIQGDWKKIGQAPRAVNESVFQEFRTVCNYFFDKRTEHYNKLDEEFETNFVQKEAICTKISALNGESDKDVFDALILEYHALGFVPRNKMKASQANFMDTTNKYIDSLDGLAEEEIQSLKLSVELGAVKGTSAEKDFIETKTRGIRNKISDLNEEVTTLNNNVEFFKHSKSIDSIRKDVDEKVAVLTTEINKLKAQLKILKIN